MPPHYADPVAYLAQNAARNAADPMRKFSLCFALFHWSRALPAGWLHRRLGRAPACLIAGSASEDNAATLEEFLVGQGVTAPRITVIDLIDLNAYGGQRRAARVHQADAGSLGHLFGDGSFELVVQDHLLNCAPFITWPAILSETRRLVHPAGVVLLHYTDPCDFPTARGQALRNRATSQPGAAALTMAAGEAANLARRPAAHRLIADGTDRIMVTLPLGNLEFFRPFSRLRDQLSEAGLTLADLHQVRITDSEGLPCRRHLCLLTAEERE